MTPHAYSLSIALLLSALLVTTGCSGQKELIARKDAQLDSLYAANEHLADELQSVRDTLQFYDDIDSGQYYRDRRLLAQEIEHLRYNLALCQDGGRTIETLLVDELFEPASANLTEAGRSTLAALAQTLHDQYVGRTIRIEGHADSTPIGPGLIDQFPSNWELSAERAGAVVRYLLDEEGLPAGQIVLTSYGSTKPVAKNDTAEGRRQNRRIRIAVLPQ